MMRLFGTIILLACLLAACKTGNPEKQGETGKQVGFPYHFPDKKPDRALSASLERLYEDYPAPRPELNEPFSQFMCTALKGFAYNDHDGTISRRDPSKILKANGKYYVWYTHRETAVPPVGMRRADEATDVIPSADWDLAHFINMGGQGKYHSMLVRFDCDLSKDLYDPEKKQHRVNHKPDVYYRQGLSKKQLERIEEENKKRLGED